MSHSLGTPLLNKIKVTFDLNWQRVCIANFMEILMNKLWENTVSIWSFFLDDTQIKHSLDYLVIFLDDTLQVPSANEQILLREV